MNCENFKEQLSEFLDGQLPPDQAQALEAHLAGCQACRSELEALRKTVTLVNRLPHLAAPPAMPAMVRERLNVVRLSNRFKILHIFDRPLPRMALAAAVVLVVFVYGYLKVPPQASRELSEKDVADAIRKSAETATVRQVASPAYAKSKASTQSDVTRREPRPTEEAAVAKRIIPTKTQEYEETAVKAPASHADMPDDIAGMRFRKEAKDADKDEERKVERPAGPSVPAPAPVASAPVPPATPSAQPEELEIHGRVPEDDRLWSKAPAVALSEPASGNISTKRDNLDEVAAEAPFRSVARAEKAQPVVTKAAPPVPINGDKKARDEMRLAAGKTAAVDQPPKKEHKASYAARETRQAQEGNVGPDLASGRSIMPSLREDARSGRRDDVSHDHFGTEALPAQDVAKGGEIGKDKETGKLTLEEAEIAQSFDIRLLNHEAFLALVARYSPAKPAGDSLKRAKRAKTYEVEIAASDYYSFLIELERVAAIVPPLVGGQSAGKKAGSKPAGNVIHIRLNVVDSPVRK